MNKKLTGWQLCAELAAIAILMSAAGVAEAGTIIKLSLGDDPTPDVQFNGVMYSTIDDLVAGTPGDQNTAVEFLDFLAFLPPIPTADASYTLNGVGVSGAPTTVVAGPSTVVVQPLAGGSFSLWDASNVLLLSADLGSSTLTGPLGPPATGAVFSTTLGSVTGGTLASLIAAHSISVSISMSDINGGSGLSVTSTPGGDELDPFTADVTEGIAAEQLRIPEPASATLLALGGLLMLARRRRG
jgi:hypothetical protein